MDIPNVKIQKHRLQQDLLELAEIGKTPAGGIMRTALSPADLEARDWFKTRMREAGLTIREDSAANIIGRMPASPELSNTPCIAIGSHIDTVPNGGKFDGALGICSGLEVIRSLGDCGVPLSRPVELIVFTDEEGSHFAGTFGSRAMFNGLVEGEVFRKKGDHQPSIAENLKRLGKDPLQIGQSARSPSEFFAFLEQHIEQGPVLEEMGMAVGIVEGIVCIERQIIHVSGTSGHAGTVPMRLRDDALVKAAHILISINTIVHDMKNDTVGTIGNINVYPGAYNIIPGNVEMHLDLRSMVEEQIIKVRESIQQTLDPIPGAYAETILYKSGVKMTNWIMKQIENACNARKFSFTKLPSGAGHDAMTFCELGIPTGMIFTPCLKGQSHCPEEDVHWDDAANGAQILADTVMRIAADPHFTQSS